MNNETFGITFQYAICKKYGLKNEISLQRISNEIHQQIESSGILEKLFPKAKPVEFLTFSKKYTSAYIRKCPHNFLLSDGKTFSIKTFRGKNKMFAPKVIGQSGDETFNHFFGDISGNRITRENFKSFCLSKVHEILPVLIDYALISDQNAWIYIDKNEQLSFQKLFRENLPDLTFERKDFSFTKETVEAWNETSTAKYLEKTIIEFQLHSHRNGYKIRLHRENFPELLVTEKKLNNSVIGDSAELAICKQFSLDSGVDNNRLENNSNSLVVRLFKEHYINNAAELFPYKPLKYGGTASRKRGENSKSGIDFILEAGKSLSLKTNKNRNSKVCPPEIGQPSPKTFDYYFSNRGWYEGEMDDSKFRQIVLNRDILAELLSEYLKHLNECDYLLWSVYNEGVNINSQLLNWYRYHYCLSQMDLSQAMGYSDSFISHIEAPSKRAKYNINHLNDIAKILKCSP